MEQPFDVKVRFLMPLYKFECDRCGEQELREMTFAEHDAFRDMFPLGYIHGSTATGGCITGIFKQVLDFHIKRAMPEHYSDTLDTVVKSEAHYKSELHRQQEEYSARMGFDVTYDLVDPGDMKAAGVTDAGLEEQARAHHDIAADGHKSSFVVNDT